MAKLVVLGNDGRREIELGAVTTIGRHPDNMVQILDRIVSKEHAQMIRQPDGAFLYRDLGSLNGSFLRGERVTETSCSARATSSPWAAPSWCSTSRAPRKRCWRG